LASYIIAIEKKSFYKFFNLKKENKEEANSQKKKSFQDGRLCAGARRSSCLVDTINIQG